MLFHRSEEGARLDDELQFHLEHQIEENIAAGMNAEEARHAALRSFGNPTALRDQARDAWTWNWLEQLWREIRYGARTLARTPGFSVIAILVMGLGIGANVALLTVVRSVLLKPLPFKDIDRLVRLFEADSQGRFQDNIVAGGTFASWKAQAHSFDDMAIMKHVEYNLSGTGGQLPELANAYVASWNVLPLLGVKPALGRSFSESDDRRDADAVVMLSWGLWKRRYGGDPGVLGKSILLDGKAYTVIGVFPAWFTYPDVKTQLWTALYHERSPELMQLHTAHNFDVIARLKPGVSIQQATVDLSGIQAQIRRQFPDGPVMDAANIRPLLEAEVRHVKTGLYVVFAATGCLLLIACLNIANLLVARSATRRKEAAIRCALGGSRARLIREQVIESMLLSAGGGALGLFFASMILAWLLSTRDDIPRADAIHMDGVVFLFTVGVILLCGLFAGLIPALSSSHKQLLKTLHEASRSVSGGRGSTRLRQFLLALEVGLTVMLLIGAGLLLKSYRQLRAVDLGCATNNVLTMDINLPQVGYESAEKRVAFFEQLQQRVRQLPGVRGVGISTVLPGQSHRRDDTFKIAEHPPLPRGEVLDAATRFVDPSYFQAMQIPLLQGRFMQPGERYARAHYVLISESLVRQYFPGEDAIGKHIAPDLGEGNKSYEIVGVVGDVLEDLGSPAEATIYYPLYMGTERSAMLAVRTASDPMVVALPIQKIIAQMDRDLPVANILTMDQILGQSTLSQNFDAKLLLAFAVLSLLLSAVGLFGVLSYIVAQRTTEIGVRIALGARREEVLKLMLLDGLRPALIGLVIGVAASIWASRLIQSLLYGTRPLDPIVFVAVSLVLLMIAALSCVMPAWKASRIDPMQALRAE
ncbi:ABC transporter permease [Alloacidobacterium dinghuense]|uniref:ABC transporter permease n=2 Tax=Alloacidobacterium dinghuense TaxID=2763107 RepID=A0A7G8BQL8_9BACT|nr:ABC transporter permease [Alloacidobacterium dinghuense]